MSFFLIFTLVLMTSFMGLIFLKRSRKNVSRSGRYRSPASAGLRLERPGRKARKLMHKLFAKPAHLVLGVAVSVLFTWLLSGYFVDGSKSGIIVSENTANAAIPARSIQEPSLSGRIMPITKQSSAANTQTVATAAAGNGVIKVAAHSAMAGSSRVKELGLLPGSAKSNLAPRPVAKALSQTQANATKAVTPKSTNVSATNKAPSAAVQKTQTAAPSAATKATTNVLPSPKAKAQLASAKAAPKALLASSRQYTVHLGSFGNRSNAENYLTQLVNAGEQAFIAETTVDGRLWHRVMSGRFESRNDAENYGRKLKKKGLTIETGRYLIKSID